MVVRRQPGSGGRKIPGIQRQVDGQALDGGRVPEPVTAGRGGGSLGQAGLEVIPRLRRLTSPAGETCEAEHRLLQEEGTDGSKGRARQPLRLGPRTLEQEDVQCEQVPRPT